jgi:hypothetical protein
VARAREGSRGEERGQGREGTTRGSGSSKRWRCGGGRAAAEVKHCRRQASRAGVPRAQGGRREGRGPGDLLVISKKFRDLSVN